MSILAAAPRRVSVAMSLMTMAVALLAGGSACGPGDEPEKTCTTFDASCAPLYPPTFDNVFQQTLKPTCAVSANCHGPAARGDRITFTDPDATHAALLARKLVEPGDAQCSTLAVRVTSTDAFTRMPPGRSLGTAESCAIQQWIHASAAR